MPGYTPAPADYWRDAVAMLAHDDLDPAAIIDALALSEHCKDMEQSFNAAIWAAIRLRDVVTDHGGR